jgi:GntR family transcriptional regulator/MocR family aminotransferase
VTIPFQSFVQLNRSSKTAVYLQVAEQLASAVQRGILPNDIKLPGARTLGKLLGVHRNTITAAYRELEAQGWLRVSPSKGCFISIKKLHRPKTILFNQMPLLERYPRKAGFTFRHSNLLDNPFEHSTCTYILNDGTPDIRLTRIERLSSLYSANLKRRSNHKKLGYYNHDGSEYFKRHLSNYLNLSRGLHISTDNLLITRSTEMSVYIIADVLLSKGDLVLVGSPGYFSVNMIFQKSGARIQTVPIDEDGIDVDTVHHICTRQQVRMLYLTPHHHYPTTVTLSAKRRAALLELSARFGFIILEDDYDFDFHYDQSPVLPLASMDTRGMVVYTGVFGKSLAPGFRTGFIVAPENLTLELKKYLGIIDRQGDVLMEQALGELIEEGDIQRYLRKSLKVYKDRRDYITYLLDHLLKGYVQLAKPSGGLAVWTKWDPQVNLMHLSKLCAQNNLFIPRSLLYQDKDKAAMRLGFGHLSFSEMDASIQILRTCLLQQICYHKNSNERG